MALSINDFEKISRNFWKHDGKNYRLFGKAVTPNGCWVIAPVMMELLDIDVATGNDVYSSAPVIEFDVTGTVSACNEFIKY